jgi:hypothetical protein
MDELSKIQIRQLFENILPKQGRTDAKQRKFLIDCIASHGYIKEKVFTEEENEEVQAEFNPNQISDLKYRFTRTFFEPTSTSFARLAELQKYGIDPQEMELAKVSEKIDTALNQLNLNNLEYIKNIAMNMYYNILLYYNSGNPLKLITNSGKVKKGFIFFVVFYALKFSKIPILKETLINNFQGITLSDLPEADKNIHRIFEKSPGYSFIYETDYDLCAKLDPDIKQKVYDLLESIKDKISINKKNIAAVIYHINKQNKTKMTFENIAIMCNVSASTISKAYREIISFL